MLMSNLTWTRAWADRERERDREGNGKRKRGGERGREEAVLLPMATRCLYLHGPLGQIIAQAACLKYSLVVVGAIWPKDHGQQCLEVGYIYVYVCTNVYILYVP